VEGLIFSGHVLHETEESTVHSEQAIVPYNANLSMLFEKNWQNKSHLHSLNFANKVLINKGHFHETKCSFHRFIKTSTDSKQVSITYIYLVPPSLIFTDCGKFTLL